MNDRTKRRAATFFALLCAASAGCSTTGQSASTARGGDSPAMTRGTEPSDASWNWSRLYGGHSTGQSGDGSALATPQHRGS